MTSCLSNLRNAAIAHGLRQTSLFSALSEDDVQQTAGYCRLRTLRKDEYLFRQNDPASGFFVVQRGIINVHRTAADGRDLGLLKVDRQALTIPNPSALRQELERNLSRR
jgi:CRP/FNR family transcriptional regulator